MHLAERTLWRSISKILWAFEISPVTDSVTGKPKPIHTAAYSVNDETIGYRGFSNRVPNLFEVSIKPRSPERIQTIRREYDEILPILNRFT